MADITLYQSASAIRKQLPSIDQQYDYQQKLSALKLYAKDKQFFIAQLEAEVAMAMTLPRAMKRGDVKAERNVKGQPKYVFSNMLNSIDGGTINRWRQLAEIPDQQRSAYYAEVQRPTRNGLLRWYEKERTRAKYAEISKGALECDLRVCSCADLFSSGINPDAVITDPPYPEEFLPCFTELAKGCEVAEVPLVAVMSGQSYLPEVMRRLCEHLKYRWTLAYLTPGGQSAQQWTAKVNTFWKPVILFGEATDWIGDVAKSNVNDNDKRFHDWGQSESGMSDLIQRLTLPGQLVCDPFLGGGTTAVVSLALGRRFVGCDIDAQSVEDTKARCLSL